MKRDFSHKQHDILSRHKHLRWRVQSDNVDDSVRLLVLSLISQRTLAAAAAAAAAVMM
jgi:hypothetical protein